MQQINSNKKDKVIALLQELGLTPRQAHSTFTKLLDILHVNPPQALKLETPRHHIAECSITLQAEVLIYEEPSEPMVMYYADGTGYPGSPGLVEIHSVLANGVDITDALTREDCNAILSNLAN